MELFQSLRKRSQLAREYAAYNSDVTSYDYYTNIDRGSRHYAGLYLPDSAPSYGVGEEPDVRYIPVPVPIPVQQPQPQYQPAQAALQPVCPVQESPSSPWPHQPSQPIPEGIRQPQPAQSNNLIPREQSLLVNPFRPSFFSSGKLLPSDCCPDFVQVREAWPEY